MEDIMAVKVGIIGATGYAGEDLVRLLSSHPDAEISMIMSKSYAGKELSELFGSFAAAGLPVLSEINMEAIEKECDIVFTGLPHGASLDVVPELLEHGVKVIDLSGDFRYNDKAVYEKWYGIKHTHEDLLHEAVYGLPEIYRERIKKSRIVANPGCYTTTSILALYPLLAKGAVKHNGIIIDAKSGTSGAGRKANIDYGFCEVNNNMKAYGVTTHRHTSEIEQELSTAAASEIMLSFTPHLLPVNRGIFATIYADLNTGVTKDDIKAAYDEFYEGEIFTHVMPYGTLPELKHVCGSNNCFIGYKIDERLSRLIIISCTDNLIKGAAGQAIENMNLMFGLPEDTGLPKIANYL